MRVFYLTIILMQLILGSFILSRASAHYDFLTKIYTESLDDCTKALSRVHK